jgi:molybdate transport system substrate-binding protein
MRRYGLLLLILGLFAPPAWGQKPPVNVAAAISLKEALTEIAQGYQADTGQPVQLSFGSSGALAAQIIQGAPVDIFISAGNQEMDEVAKAGLIQAASRRVVCQNELVLIVPADAANPPRTFQDLLDAAVQHVAVGQPKTVPAGLYAMQVLENLKIADAIEGKLVMGENVRQVLDYVIRGEVDAGMVYATDALIGGNKVRVVAHADPKLHDPIEYPAAIVSTDHAAEAEQFLTYLSTNASAEHVFISHGFLIAAPATTAPTTIPSP